MDILFKQLSRQLSGELHTDALHLHMYATDASVYRKVPQAVAYPRDTRDIQRLVLFASKNNITLIPRTAGTSLAGQCVGDGIVVDVSKHFTDIIHLDVAKQQVTVQPGVIRDQLNEYLKPHGLFFGPNTSTANRCMIGGMVGNNSSGTTSIKYGVTRDKVIRLKTVLSDGSEVVFESLSDTRFREKCQLTTLEGSIYKTLKETLSVPEIQHQIREEFPKPEIHRRNTGYAIDALIHQQPFTEDGSLFNLCSLLAGSEGTLAFTTEITLQLDELPPAHGVLVAAHFETLQECLKAVSLTMNHDLYTCEMMDKVILDCTKNNRTQLKNRFFIEGDPAAILTLEVRDTTIEKARLQANALVNDIEASGLSYAYPILEGKQIDQAMELRKAGLGLLGNIIGDRKAVACIEDTAVALEDLAAYIDDFTEIMDDYEQEAVYYAHAGAGELHLRPILNLKKAEDVVLFRKITTDVAKLVKSYQGSMSGEHGDGIVRSEFIAYMIGEKNYELLRKIKYTFDPQSIFNKGKIIDPLPMDTSLRYEIDREEPEITTLFNFDDQEGILRSAEKCNGSGDCRKLPSAGGTMCPSYRATRNEKDTTRARANALREFLTTSEKSNPFDHEELKEVFDLCVSCKACASECPSNVDVATLKAEFEYQYQKSHTISLRTKLFTNTTQVNRIAAEAPWLYNSLLPIFSSLIKPIFKIAKQRSLPKLDLFTDSIFSSSKILPYAKNVKKPEKKVLLFVDEFTEYIDGSIGKDTFELLLRLGYEVECIQGLESGRAYISKGFLDHAKGATNKTVAKLRNRVSENTVCVGIEPSAILTFRDEYLRLANDIEGAKRLAKHSYTIEEFLHQEIKLGNISPEQFSAEAKTLKIHAHCHQKALSSVEHTFAILNLPVNYTPTIIPSGCCGMAGSFGYEKEHYEVSMQMGEQTLFPAIRKADDTVIIAANGTSCRHQIKDGTKRIALHPVTILKQALLIE
ncbi:oxidoreductase [Dokdonia pacifica]|uniref:FAD/FMN-containing dehydrogenase n=1 Tax=Dokdonia pacifica TaxID=1627892 RepID=A0A238YVG8_9FLAO|nr:FAD-binding and (Fe-S)-binding domain-containing protein [Dokdonia pacifica]GGG10003.1 oxidoreductase [Dokdonia pacifica]SNR74721.1 FAD/FMN-containing dehydrogenase [Dokdonia pacifica]